MAIGSFSVAVADLDRGDIVREWGIPVEWLEKALDGTEASPAGAIGKLQVSLHKQGVDVVVAGTAQVEVVIPCARTLDPVNFDLVAELYLLLAPATVADATGQQRHNRRREKPLKLEEKELSEEEAAEDTYSGDHVILDEFVREHLLLELPLFPLRPDLRFQPESANGPPPMAFQTEETAVDPRLAPLAAIAQKLKAKQNKN